MATALGIKPDSRKVFQYRLYSLITDGGALVYRKVFTEYATKMSGSVSEHIKKYKPAIQQSFLQRRINREQFDRLFPDRSPVVTVDTCDVTLLAFLVRVTCVEETDDEILHNKITDLNKLRLFRNEIAHIHGTEEYDESTFDEIWQRIKVVIKDLGQGIPNLEEEIDELKVKPIDPDREKELQKLITDLKEKAAVAKDLEKTIAAAIQDQMGTVVTKLTEDGDKRDKKVLDQIDKKGNALMENQKALMIMLQQIYIDPWRQLPSNGDFDPEIEIPLRALPESITYRQDLPKERVTRFEKSDYEDLSKAIDLGWQKVADNLGLSRSQIEGILAKFDLNENQAYIEEMVNIWGEREQDDATIERFIKIVVDCPNIKVDALEGILGRHCIIP